MPSGLLCLAAVGLAACGGKQTQQQPPSAIASIDGHELTMADLAASPRPYDSETNTTQRQAVDALIDQYLLAQEAQAKGLDQEPAVVSAIRNARRRILAETFATQLANTAPQPPSSADIEEYYRRNPALFSQRRLYSLIIFTVDSAAVTSALLETIGHTTSADALGKALKRHAVPFDTQRLERTADELPLSELSQYSAASVGDVLVAAHANGTSQLIQIAGIELRPKPLDSARAGIERYLTQLHSTAAIEAYLAHARARSRISYYLEEGSRSHTTGAPVPAKPQSAVAESAHNRDADIAALN